MLEQGGEAFTGEELRPREAGANKAQATRQGTGWSQHQGHWSRHPDRAESHIVGTQMQTLNNPYPGPWDEREKREHQR